MPQTSPNGYTVPVPNNFSVSQSGQVTFYYGPSYSGMQQAVPVSGVNPFNLFNGMNGMPHWSSLTTSTNLGGMVSNFYGGSSGYSSLNNPLAAFGGTSAFGTSPSSPISVASVYNPPTGTQIGTSPFAINTPTSYINNSSSYYNNTSAYTNSSSNYNNSLSILNQTNYNSSSNNSSAQAQQALANNLGSALSRTTNDLLGQGRSLFNSGRDQLAAGQLEKALATNTRALTVSQLAGDKVGQAVHHASIAQVYLAMGDGQQAAEQFDRAYQMARQAKDVRLQVMAMRGSGAAYLASGEANQALEAYRRARALLHDDPATEAEILTGIGWVYQSSGELKQALAHYQEALTLVTKTGNRVTEVKTRVGIGLLYQSFGESKKALEQYSAALEIAKRTLEVTDAEVAGILISAAEAYQALEMRAKALDLYTKSLELLKGSGNKTAETGTLISLGRTYLAMGFPQMALGKYRDALKLAQAEGNRVGEAGALSGLGEMYFWAGLRGYSLTKPADVETSTGAPANKTEAFITLKGGGPAQSMMSGDFAKAMKQALKYYEDALGVMKTLGNQVGEVGLFTNMGLVYDSWDKPEKALDAYHKAINGMESLRAAARLEEFRTSLAQQSAIVYQRAILLHYRLGQQAQAFELSERARARTFLDQMGNARLDIRKGADADLMTQEQGVRLRIVALEQQLTRELAQPVGQLKPEAIRALETRLAAERRTYEDLLTRLKASSPEYVGLVSVGALTLDKAQQMLAPDMTLVSYLVTPDLTLAFVLARDSFRIVKMPVRQRELEHSIAGFRDFSSLDEAPPASLKQLHKWLIAPLKSQIKTPLVGIVPHGVLHNLPFAALTNGKGYLGDTHTIFYLPSISALPFIQQKQQPAEGQLLALAYGQKEGASFLRYAEEEAQSVASLYQTQAHVGEAATKATLRAHAGESTILHLVAHYQPNLTHPLFSRLLLAPAEKDSGALDLQEVYEMDLKRTNLVVLSACQTQVGTQSRGDDITALNRAFLYAGTPTVVASLWSVDDQATNVLMTSFYKHLKAGMSKAEALRTAQTETRLKYPNPYYWAGFVLTGHPGTSTVRDSSRTALMTGTPAYTLTNR